MYLLVWSETVLDQSKFRYVTSYTYMGQRHIIIIIIINEIQTLYNYILYGNC